jgi:hypothetical protein
MKHQHQLSNQRSTARRVPAKAVIATLCLLLAATLTTSAQLRSSAGATSTTAGSAANLAQAQQTLARQPAIFIENKGQWDSQAKFLLRSPGLDLWITNNGAVYDLNRVEQVDAKGPRLAGAARPESPISSEVPQLKVTRTPVFITYEGASRQATAVGSGKLPEYHNYYIGNDPSKWADHVALYSDARVQGLYNGIDAVFYLDQGRPRYDLVVAAGADPAKIRMKIEGATKVDVAANGSLRIATTLGTIEQRGLFAYQQIDGRKQKVSCAFMLGKDGSVSLSTGRYDRTRPLVIDPLVWSTYLGGTSNENAGGGGSIIGKQGAGGIGIAGAIAVDGSGNVYVTGTTASTNFPTLNALQSGKGGSFDAFVTKLTSAGVLSYSTYLGGSTIAGCCGTAEQEGLAIAVDGNSNAYITGYTGATNFPTLNATQGSNAGGFDAFVTKLTSSGALSYSTYLGGSFNDKGYAIAVDGSGNMYVAGFTGSLIFPGASGQQNTQGFVTKLSSSGSISFSKYVTGEALGVAVDGSSNIYITGNTQQNNSGAAEDVYATKLTSSGSVSYSVTFGASSANDVGEAIAVDANGNAYITGFTESNRFPTTENAAQATSPTPNQDQNGSTFHAFVTKLTSSGTTSWSTYLGGTGQDFGIGITLDAGDNVYVTGATGSSNFPTLDPLQSSNAGASDAFVTRYTSSGVVSFSTYFGGSSHDNASGIAVDGSGHIYVTGFTGSDNFPTQNAAQGSRAGGNDAFVTKLLINSITSVSLSGSSPYCSGSTVAVTWQSSGVSSVNIDFSTDGGTNWSSVATSQTSGTSGGTYYWTVPNSPGSNRKIRVRDASNSSVRAISSVFTINAPPSVTDDPDDVTTTAFASGGASFSAAATGTGPIDIQWELSTNNGGSWSPLSGATSSTFSLSSSSLVTSRSGYRFRAAFTNACSTVYSQPATLTVNKATATVALDNLSHAYDGSSKGATVATIPAGLTVNIAYEQNGSSVSDPTAAGDYDVTATIDDANYEGSATGTLTIDKATLTVSADDKTKTYGDDNPSLTASYSGFVGNEDASMLSGSPSLATAADAASGVGDYAITASQGTLAADNYQFSFQDGVLSVTKKSLTVTADDKTKAYGDDNPAFTAGYDGFVNGQDETVLDGTLAFATLATASSGVGSYAITPSGLTSDNYDITFDDGTLTVTKAEVTVTADNKTKTYGDDNPTFTASYGGFVNGDDESVLSGAPSLSTTATAASDVGDYTITAGAGGLDADNYSFSFVNGTLGITAAPLTVTADNKEKICGQSNPTLTGTIDGIRNDDEITASYSTSATSSSTAGDYAIVPSASGTKLSNYSVTYVNGTLTVNPLSITGQPSDQDVVSGGTASFSASFSGTASVQWQVSSDGGTNWTNISNATSTTLSFTASMSQSGNQYRALFDNGTCTGATNPATLTVKIYATDLGPAVVFLGPANPSDDGRRVDLKVEIYKNTTLISSGTATDVIGSGPNQNSSRKTTIALTMANGAASFAATDQLVVKVYARRNGGNSDFNALLWYNDSPVPSINHGNKGWARVGNVTQGGSNTGYFYLRSSSALNTAAGSSGTSIQRTLGTSSWALFDTWTMYGSSMKPITTGAVTGGMAARVVPNPLHTDVAMLQLNASKPGDATVTVYDLLGRPVLQMPPVPIDHAGEMVLPLDLSSLSSGLYTVRIAMENETVTTSITLVR